MMYKTTIKFLILITITFVFSTSLIQITASAAEDYYIVKLHHDKNQ